MNLIKQSDATKAILLFMASSSAPTSGATGLTLAVRLSKNGAAFAAGTGTVAELEGGFYAYTPSSADTGTLGPLGVRATATGAVDFAGVRQVVPFDPYDAQALGLGSLPTTGRLAVKPAVTLASSDVTGNVAADVQTIKTQAVTCAAGVTVLASVGTAATSTAQTGDAYARLGAPAGASVSADIAAIKSDTGTILTDVNTGAGAIYTRIGAPAGASIAADIAAAKASIGSPWQVGSKYAVTLASGDVSGNLPADLAAVLATALTETVAGNLAGSLKKFLDVATPTLTAASVNQTGDAFARIGTNGAGLTAIGDTRLANLDAAVSSRSTFASGGNVNVASFTAGSITAAAFAAGAITSGVAPNLDAAVSTRSTYAGTDTAGTTTLLGRITAAVALAGTAPTWYTAPVDVSAGVNAIVAKLPVNAIADETLVIAATNSILAAVPSAAQNAAATLTTAMAESYAAAGSGFTLAQALYEIASNVEMVSIGGTTGTTYKRDGATIATTFTLDSATSPSTRKRAT